MSSVPVNAQETLPLCHLVATGGTIAMKTDPATGAPVPALSGTDLLDTVPGLQDIARITVENPYNVPSSYMGPSRWRILHRAISRALDKPEVSGVIVSHGTDTLEETAFFLDLTIDGRKPVILIGAQRSASEPGFDGPRNLLNASRICVSSDARGKGVMIAMNDRINAAREATKTHTSNVETFRPGETGFLGSIDPDRIIFYRIPLRRQYIPLLDRELPKVEIITTYAGADGDLIRAAVRNGAAGIVIQAVGMGNVNKAVYEAIQTAIAKGLAVVISTRVHDGRVLPFYGFTGGGRTLADAGAIFADDLSSQKARILLMLALQTTSDPGNIQSLFSR